MNRIRASLLVAAAFCPVLAGCGSAEPCPDSGVVAVEATTPAGPVFMGYGDPYEAGPLDVRTIEVARCEVGSPRPLQIHVPLEGGPYAVVLFQHGFTVPSRCYEQLLRHLASHGFVVVAPQMYAEDPLPIGKGSTLEEADDVLAVVDWLPEHLSSLAGVATDMRRMGIVGHSRGGKVVWRVLLRAVDRFTAAAQIDPTDGTLDGTDEVTLQRAPFSLPLLIVGAGPNPTGPTGEDFLCTLLGYDHVKYFTACQPPAWHVVAPYARHVDMLDDERSDCGGAPLLCGPGADPAGMRRLTAGMMVAVFREALQGDVEALSFLSGLAGAPVPIWIEAK